LGFTQTQYEGISPLLPKQRGNVSLSNPQEPGESLHVAEYGCKWRGLSVHFGHRHGVCIRVNQSRSGVQGRVFEPRQQGRSLRIKVEVIGLCSPMSRSTRTARVHERNGLQETIGKSRGGWHTRIHGAATDAPAAVAFTLSSAGVRMPHGDANY